MTREEKCKLFESKGYTYNPETGEIKNSWSRIVNSKHQRGYIKLSTPINKKTTTLFGHHFAWWMVYREVVLDKLIDHEDRDTSNNKISNLRIVTPSKNTRNSDLMDNFIGVYYIALTDNWRAEFYVEKKKIYLGYFDTFEEGRNAVLDALKIHDQDRYKRIVDKSR
jgi:hypothetical protein